MLCLSGFELYSRWVPLFYARLLNVGLTIEYLRRNKARCNIPQMPVCFAMMEKQQCRKATDIVQL